MKVQCVDCEEPFEALDCTMDNRVGFLECPHCGARFEIEWAAIADDENRELSDDENPDYMFSTTWTSLLVQAVNDKISLPTLARKELANRGLDHDGVWIGFDKAKQQFEKDTTKT